MQSHTEGSRQIETEPLQKRAEPDDTDLSASRASTDSGSSKAGNAGTGLVSLERERERTRARKGGRANLAAIPSLGAVGPGEIAPLLCSPKVAERTWLWLGTVFRMYGARIPPLPTLGHVPDRGRLQRGLDAIGGRDGLAALMEKHKGSKKAPIEWYRAIDARIPEGAA